MAVMKSVLTCLFVAWSINAFAQVQNPLRQLGTNIYDFGPVFRSYQQREIVSSPFLVLGEVFQINDNGVHIIRKEPNFHLSDEFTKELMMADTGQALKIVFAENKLEKWRLGNLSAGEMMAMDPETRGIVLEEIEREKTFFNSVRVLVTNCPNASVLLGKQVAFFAMPVGTYTFTDSANNVSTIPRYDYGQPYLGVVSNRTVFLVTKAGIVRKQTSQELAEKNAVTDRNLLSWQLQQASNGIAYVQFDLAKRYLNGNGVIKDESAARFWLKSSADQKYEPAIELLNKTMLQDSH